MSRHILKQSLLIAIVLCTVVLVVFAANNVASDTVEVGLGKYIFQIPKKNVSPQNTIPVWLSNIPGLDDGSRDYLLIFTAEEVAQHIHGYHIQNGKYKEDIRARLSVLTEKEVKRYEDPGFSHRGEVWYGTGLFEDRYIERWEEADLYRVYHSKGHTDLWTLLSQYPDSSKPIPTEGEKFWVASCIDGNSPVTKSGKRVSCHSYTYFDDIAIDFYMSEQNVHAIDEVRSFIKAKVLEWKVFH